MFKMTSFVDFGLYLKAFNSLRTIYWTLGGPTEDTVRNPKFMEQNLSTVIDRTPPLGVGVSYHMKLHYQLCTMTQVPLEPLLVRTISGLGVIVMSICGGGS